MSSGVKVIAFGWLILVSTLILLTMSAYAISIGDPCMKLHFPLVSQLKAGTSTGGGMMCDKDGNQVEDPAAVVERIKAREARMNAADRRQVQQITKAWMQTGETHSDAIQLALDEVEAFSGDGF